MKKKILFGLAITFLFIFPPFVLAWDDCIFGEVDCTYPGDCPRYVDTDNDGVCDHSEPAPADRMEEVSLTDTSSPDSEIYSSEDLISGQELKEKTVAEVAAIYGINSHDYAHALREYVNFSVEPETDFLFLHDNFALEPSVAKDIALSLKAGEPENVSAIVEAAQVSNEDKDSRYNFIPLSLILFCLYIFTWLLAKFQKIKLLNHRKIWNCLLLFTFLASGLSGIFLVIRINYGILIPWPFNLLQIHVETGIAMAVISIFHIIWHWPYYLNFLIKKK